MVDLAGIALSAAILGREYLATRAQAATSAGTASSS
jgi:hypothetical protein